MEIYVSVLKYRFAILILDFSNCDFAFRTATVVVEVLVVVRGSSDS